MKSKFIELVKAKGVYFAYAWIFIAGILDGLFPSLRVLWMTTAVVATLIVIWTTLVKKTVQEDPRDALIAELKKQQAEMERNCLKSNARLLEEKDNLKNYYELKLSSAQAELKEAWDRHDMATRMVQSYGEERCKIIKNLDRFGMSLDGNNEIVVRGPKMTRPVFKNGEMIKPPQMIPIMAKGLVADPPPKVEGDLIPIICWYRVIPDERVKGKFNEVFSHFEDAEMTLQDPKNRKNRKMVVKTPTSDVPQSRAGTKFTGKWVWHQKFRTDDVSPQIIDA